MHLLLPVLGRTYYRLDLDIQFNYHIIASQEHLQTCKLVTRDFLIVAALLG